MKSREVIERFVEQYYNPKLKDVKSGNYATAGGGLYLFGNKIAWHTESGICADYRGPYAGNRTTNKALHTLRSACGMALTERRQAMLFVQTFVKEVRGKKIWEQELPEVDDDKVTTVVTTQREPQASDCNLTGENQMSDVIVDGVKLAKAEFKIKIGAPTNSEQVYLAGTGIKCHDLVIAHALPVYRQKDYPVYQARKNGPYCVSLIPSGLRISGTNQKLVFAKLEPAAEFGVSVANLFALLGFPMSEEDPRKVLEYAKEHREELYEPMVNLSAQYEGVLVTPETAAKADGE